MTIETWSFFKGLIGGGVFAWFYYLIIYKLEWKDTNVPEDFSVMPSASFSDGLTIASQHAAGGAFQRLRRRSLTMGHLRSGEGLLSYFRKLWR